MHRVFYNACIITMSVFEADTESLENLVLTKPRSRSQNMNTFLEQNVCTKFCSLCSHFNIDPIDPYALQTIILLMCKSRESLRIASSYLELARISGIVLDPKFQFRTVDDNQNESPFDHIDEIFSSISDWAILLAHVSVELDGDQLQAMDKNPIMSRMREALREACITQMLIPETHFLVLCLFYMSPRGTLAPKMIERLCLRCGVASSDIELRCMRFVTRYMDATMDEMAQNKLYVDLALNLQVDSNFNTKIRSALSAAVEASHVSDKVSSRQRIQLRYLAARLHSSNVLSYSQTFENWRASHKFGNVTSTQIQKILYFIKVQETATPEDVYERLFTREILMRVRMGAVDRIDPRAITDIIKSLRVYGHNIQDLLDFRTECLLGLSITARKTLTLAQVAQLYISVFQHDSIWEECWRSVVNVMNHTIIAARAKFKAGHAYDTRGVCSNIINCLVHHPISATKKRVE